MSIFLLVHGGMSGGWCWNKVRSFLELTGQTVLTPTLTGLGERKHLSHKNIDLDLHIEDIVNTIIYEDLDNINLVGHSYGGMVITGVADRVPQKIKQLIYVDALLPFDGESMFDIIDQNIVDHLYNSAKDNGEGWQVQPASAEKCGLSDPEDIKRFNAYSTPHPLKTFQQPIHLKNNAIKNLDKIYIKCTQDSALNPMLVRAKELGIRCRLLDSGHYPMITQPQKLADLLTD